MLTTTAVLALLYAEAAHAQAASTETITVTGVAPTDSAIYQAPTKAPLDAIQPTSVISQQFIQNNVPLSANYDSVIKIAPSVSTTSPNGPGLQESTMMSIRGFQDGQYNVTFDGIPWGDSNDFTHHSTSYFAAHDLGDVSIDRGPGTAATIGYATFGGTVSINSKDPLSEMTLTPYASFGSFNTQLYGTEFDTGTLTKYGQTEAFIDAQGLNSDGYLTNSGQERENFFLKVKHRIGANTELTFVAMYNNIRQNVGLGATSAQIAKFGPNYMLSSNPNSQNFYGYNNDQIHTDFEYLGLKTNFGDGWSLDNKIYSNAYYHRGLNGLDPNGETPNGTVVNGVSLPNGVPGQLLQNDYRAFGDITRLQKTFSFGDAQFGFWYNHQISSRSLFEVDDTSHFDLNTLSNANGNPVDSEIHQHLDTYQPYAQFNWNPLPGLTLSPGVKYSLFVRSIDAQTNLGTQLPLNTTKNYDAVLPSFLAHYSITSNWAAYAQVAEGFLAPNENVLQIPNPAFSNVKPQQSWNYQVGTSYQTSKLSASIDAYYIDFSNLIGHQTIGGITEFFNQGGVTYKGLEAEATYYVGSGVSVYGNGSLNSAKDKVTGLTIAEAPAATAAFGAIYDQDGWYGSLINKWVGSRYGNAGKQAGLDPYSTLDLAVGYKPTSMPAGLPPADIKIEVNNLLDNTKIYDLAGTTVGQGTNLWWTMPGRSVFVSISVPL